jgi:hypothetical protein
VARSLPPSAWVANSPACVLGCSAVVLLLLSVLYCTTAAGDGARRECVRVAFTNWIWSAGGFQNYSVRWRWWKVVSDLHIGGVSSSSTFFFVWSTFLCHYSQVEARDDNVSWTCSSVLARRRRFCVVGQNTSVVALCLPPYCIASHEIIAVTDFNGAENFCAGLISASLRRLLFILSCSIRRGRSWYGPYPGTSQLVWSMLGFVNRHGNFGVRGMHPFLTHLHCSLFLEFASDLWSVFTLIATLWLLLVILG